MPEDKVVADYHASISESGRILAFDCGEDCIGVVSPQANLGASIDICIQTGTDASITGSISMCGSLNKDEHFKSPPQHHAPNSIISNDRVDI